MNIAQTVYRSCRAEYFHHVAYLHARDIGHVYHAEVHAYAAYCRAHGAAYGKRRRTTAEMTVDTIGVAYGYGGYHRVALQQPRLP